MYTHLVNAGKQEALSSLQVLVENQAGKAEPLGLGLGWPQSLHLPSCNLYCIDSLAPSMPMTLWGEDDIPDDSGLWSHGHDGTSAGDHLRCHSRWYQCSPALRGSRANSGSTIHAQDYNYDDCYLQGLCHDARPHPGHQPPCGSALLRLLHLTVEMQLIVIEAGFQSSLPVVLPLFLYHTQLQFTMYFNATLLRGAAALMLDVPWATGNHWRSYVDDLASYSHKIHHVSAKSEANESDANKSHTGAQAKGGQVSCAWIISSISGPLMASNYMKQLWVTLISSQRMRMMLSMDDASRIATTKEPTSASALQQRPI